MNVLSCLTTNQLKKLNIINIVGAPSAPFSNHTPFSSSRGYFYPKSGDYLSMNFFILLLHMYVATVDFLRALPNS